jgi:hypothetical protein
MGMGKETAYSKKIRRMGDAKERSKAAQLGCSGWLITAGDSKGLVLGSIGKFKIV